MRQRRLLPLSFWGRELEMPFAIEGDIRVGNALQAIQLRGMGSKSEE